jgi:putative transposase
LDEASPQTTSNTVRVWSFSKPSIVKNTTRIKANTFGFYALNGHSVVNFYEESKKEYVCLFLETIREQNPNKRIVIILDNFRSHHALDTLKYAEMLNICLVFLPPYSPDLNPIEFIWKDDKREVSTTYITSKEQMRTLIADAYTVLSRKLSYASAWIDKFLTPLHISITS